MREAGKKRGRAYREASGKGGFLKGAVLIAGGGFIAKIIGALYRIPLTNILGGYGMGLYQIVYPVYCILLTVSATGIPSSIAKLTAERIGKKQTVKPLFKTAMKLFVVVGLVGTALMIALAPFLARMQNSKEVTAGYFALAPSVFLVSAISVYRGYFQGKNNMFPTALSEVVEQVVKVAIGLLLARLFRSDVAKAVVFLLLAVSISELVALLLMMWLYRREQRRLPLQNMSLHAEKQGGKYKMRDILRLSIPVTFSSILLPLSNLIDSVLVVRFLNGFAQDGVALYGLFSGGAITIMNLCVSVCYGVAVASVPAVSQAKAEKETETETGDKRKDGKKTKKPSVRKRIFYALGLTVAIALPISLGMYLFAERAVQVVFRSLSGEQLQILTSLTKALALGAFTLSLVQTLSACLTAQGKPQYGAVAMLLSVLVKTGTYCLLFRRAVRSVFAVAYATNLGYLVAFLLDLLYNLYVSKNKKKKAGKKV